MTFPKILRCAEDDGQDETLGRMNFCRLNFDKAKFKSLYKAKF